MQFLMKIFWKKSLKWFVFLKYFVYLCLNNNGIYFVETTESNTEYKGALQTIQEAYDDTIEYDYTKDNFLAFSVE